jgi:predicted enzyme related to lactoylglutathione lyase
VITGAHAILFTEDAEGIRAFFRDVLELPAIDAGGGWLIFAVPPSELAAHPADGPGRRELYLMCDDIHATLDELARKGADIVRPVSEASFRARDGDSASDGSELGLYEPRHPRPVLAELTRPDQGRPEGALQSGR